MCQKKVTTGLWNSSIEKRCHLFLQCECRLPMENKSQWRTRSTWNELQTWKLHDARYWDIFWGSTQWDSIWTQLKFWANSQWTSTCIVSVEKCSNTLKDVHWWYTHQTQAPQVQHNVHLLWWAFKEIQLCILHVWNYRHKQDKHF
jgi:hypothetical protein